MRYFTNKGGSNLAKLCDTRGAAYYLLGGQRILIKKASAWCCGEDYAAQGIRAPARRLEAGNMVSLVCRLYLHTCALAILTHLLAPEHSSATGHQYSQTLQTSRVRGLHTVTIYLCFGFCCDNLSLIRGHLAAWIGEGNHRNECQLIRGRGEEVGKYIHRNTAFSIDSGKIKIA